MGPITGCLRIHQFLLGGKTHKYHYEKPTNLPAQGQPNPRKIGQKWHLGHFFPQQFFFFVGWDWFYIGNRLQETQPNQILREQSNTLY